MLYWHVLSLLVSLVISAPLESGQPGGPWTEQEIDIVRAKVLMHYLQIGNSCYLESPLVKVAFIRKYDVFFKYPNLQKKNPKNYSKLKI